MDKKTTKQLNRSVPIFLLDPTWPQGPGIHVNFIRRISFIWRPVPVCLICLYLFWTMLVLVHDMNVQWERFMIGRNLKNLRRKIVDFSYLWISHCTYDVRRRKWRLLKIKLLIEKETQSVLEAKFTYEIKQTNLILLKPRSYYKVTYSGCAPM